MQQVTDRHGNTYIISDRVRAMVDPDGETVTTEYDPDGNAVIVVRSVLDGDGGVGDPQQWRLLDLAETDLAVKITPITIRSSNTDSEVRARLEEAANGRAAEIEATVAEITEWWTTTAKIDAETTAPKAAEYGAADLAIMGKAMEQLFPNATAMPPEERERVGLEMACAFYTLGKVARVFGAYQQGRMPHDDSWFDLTVYSLMARRIRQFGKWV